MGGGHAERDLVGDAEQLGDGERPALLRSRRVWPSTYSMIR